MNIKSFHRVDYENISNWKLGENKPNSNPIQTQTKPVLSAVEWANFKRNLAKMGHHEAVKCVDTAPQFTLNLIKSSKAKK